MDVLEVGPGVGRDALLVQLVLTQIQQSQVAAAPQRLLCHAVNHVLTHLQHLQQTFETHRWKCLIWGLKVKSGLSTVLD